MRMTGWNWAGEETVPRVSKLLSRPGWASPMTTSPTERIGFTLHSGDYTVAEIREITTEAEKLGFDGFWLTEESGKEAFSLLGDIATRTKRLKLGTGIINIYSRTPTLIAMGVSTLDEISAGRMFLGLGTGGVGFIERGHGLKITAHVERMSEYVSIIRKLLSWERLDYSGVHFNNKDFKQRQKPPRKDVPIYVAALNHKMQQVAGEVADGVVVNMLTRDGVREIREDLKAGAARSGRDPARDGIYALSMALTGDGPEAKEALKKGVAFYCASQHYHHIMEREGFGDEARKVKALWDRGDLGSALDQIPDEMLARLTLFGSPEEIRRRIDEYLGLGVYPILYPVITKNHAKDDVLYVLRSAAGGA